MILDSQYRRADGGSVGDSSQGESLYCRTLSVQLKDDFCASARRVSSLCLTVRQASSSVGRKELQIQLTDDADPFFVYALTLTDEDFQSLKSQQGLLVDFLAFPQKFVDLLDLCTRDEHKESPRFVLSLLVHGRTGSDPAVLDVVETNPFKHLVHLSLKLSPAPDSAVRKHLTSAMRQLKEENRRLEAALRNSETDFQSRVLQYQESAAERLRELEHSRSLHASQIASLRDQHERELAAEREKARKASSEQQFRTDLEHRETEQRLRKQVQTLEAQVSLLEALNKDLQEKLSKSEQSARDLSLKVTTLEAAVGQCQRTAEVLSKEKDSVQADKQVNEKDVTALRSRVSELEAEVLQKSRLLAETKGLLDICEQKKRQAESLVEQRQAQLSRREAAVKTLSEDVLKGNEIIRRLQGELRTYHSKLRHRSEVITKQEDVLTEKEQQVQSLVRKIDDLELANKKKGDELARAQQQVEEAQQKLAESQKQVKTNENVIQWLNKQLNACQTQQQEKRGSPVGLSSSKQVPFSNAVPGVRQQSPVVPKGNGDPLIDPRFLQPMGDPTAHRLPGAMAAAAAVTSPEMPLGGAAAIITRQVAPATTTPARPHYPASTTRPS
ncbi:spindle assembly abnormal protein 6 homolog isoform X2 [Haemaphysalis longicornis]